MQAPQSIKAIPSQIVNEGASYGPLDLKKYIESPEGDEVQFQAELESGSPLPNGLICMTNGIISGIPAANTQGDYSIVVNAKTPVGSLSVTFKLIIKARITLETAEAFAKLKAEVWEALNNGMPIPEGLALLERDISPTDIYFLLQRFASFTIWNVYDLNSPGEKKILDLPGASKHFNVYDRGSCLVASPTDLFSHERTLEDALQTARAMAGEVYKRDWVIEFAGLDKMARAAWVELQLIGTLNNKYIDVLNFTASQNDMNIYEIKRSAPGFQAGGGPT